MMLTPGANLVPAERVEILAGALAQPSPRLDQSGDHQPRVHAVDENEVDGASEHRRAKQRLEDHVVPRTRGAARTGEGRRGRARLVAAAALDDGEAPLERSIDLLAGLLVHDAEGLKDERRAATHLDVLVLQRREYDLGNLRPGGGERLPRGVADPPRSVSQRGHEKRRAACTGHRAGSPHRMRADERVRILEDARPRSAAPRRRPSLGASRALPHGSEGMRRGSRRGRDGAPGRGIGRGAGPQRTGRRRSGGQGAGAIASRDAARGRRGPRPRAPASRTRPRALRSGRRWPIRGGVRAARARSRSQPARPARSSAGRAGARHDLRRSSRSRALRRARSSRRAHPPTSLRWSRRPRRTRPPRITRIMIAQLAANEGATESASNPPRSIVSMSAAAGRGTPPVRGVAPRPPEGASGHGPARRGLARHPGGDHRSQRRALRRGDRPAE